MLKDLKPSGTGQRKRGRPVKYKMPQSIPDTPENIARAIMAGPPKKNWDFLRASKRKR